MKTFRAGLVCLLFTGTIFISSTQGFAEPVNNFETHLQVSTENEEVQLNPGEEVRPPVEDPATVIDSVYRDEQDQNEELVTDHNQFSYSHSSLSFGALSINSPATRASIIINIEKWGENEKELSVSMSDFFSGEIPDPTGNSTMRVSFPNSACEIRSVTVLKDGVVTDEIIGSESRTDLKILLPTTSEGTYQVEVEYELTLPDTSIIQSVSEGGSKYHPGMVIGLPAANYTMDLIMSEELIEETGHRSVSIKM